MEWKIIGKDELGPVVRARPTDSGFEVQTREKGETGFGWSEEWVVDPHTEVGSLTVKRLGLTYHEQLVVEHCYRENHVVELAGGINLYWQEYFLRIRNDVPTGWDCCTLGCMTMWYRSPYRLTLTSVNDSSPRDGRGFTDIHYGAVGAPLLRGHVHVQLYASSTLTDIIEVYGRPQPADDLASIPFAEWDQLMERLAAYCFHHWTAVVEGFDGPKGPTGVLVGSAPMAAAQAVKYFLANGAVRYHQ